MKSDWEASCGDVEEAIPPNTLKPLGNEVDLWLFVDSDHTRDEEMRCSRAGFMI